MSLMPTLTGTATLGDGNNNVTLTGTARADAVIAGSGDNTFTVKGKGAVFNLLDGGMGSNDTLVFDAAVHRLTSASTIQNFERVALKNNSLLTLDEALVLTDGGIAAGGVDVELGSELAVKPSVAGDFTFDPALTGQGLVSVSLDSSQSDFAFTGNTGSDFAGTLKLGSSHFQLEGDNTYSLTQAALVAGNGSVVTVGTGEQQLGGLSFDGGTVQFGAVMPGDIIADNHIITSADGTLDIGGKGTVQVTLGGGVINHVPASLSKKSLMEQDDATTLVQLAGANGTVKGTGGQLNLVDENGNVISDVQLLDIVQDGNTVAKGTWDYQMVSSSDGITSDGLYIAYGLKEVELLGTGENALTLAVGADAQGLQTDLRVKVTGSGDLAIDTGNGQTVSLSNGGNDYTGATSVFSGTLRLDADNALGLTSAVNVAADSVLDMHGSLQTAGALNTEAGSQVMLNDGSRLTLSDARREAGNNDAGTIAGNTLTGAGELEVLSGELHVDGANSGYTGSGTDPDTGSQPKPDWIRPEASLYGVNMAAANTLFTHRLHDRLGETHYVDALTGEKKVTSMWLRNVGGHTRSKDSSGQMNTQSNRYVMQMGGDIAQWSSNDDNRYHLGVMAGYANQKSNARNHLNGNKADSSINGYSLGLYGTWLQDNEAKTGAWLDTWLLYNWFDNTVRGKSASSASYKSKGFTASVEGGYTWKLGERDERTAYYIQPKAQAIWMGVKADDLTESNGTRVTGEGDGNIQTRLGARAFIKGHSTLDDAKERTFEPFIEANWIHNTETFGATLNGVRVNQAGTRNIGELKVGVEGQLSRNVNLWGNVAQQVGDDGYSDSSAMLGLKVSF